jgi:hypothetical protein
VSRKRLLQPVQAHGGGGERGVGLGILSFNFKLIKLFNEILYCFRIWSFVEVLCVKNGRRLSFEFDDPSSLAESKQAAFPGIHIIRNYSGVLSESQPWF